MVVLPGVASWVSHDAALASALTAAGVPTSRDVRGVAIKDANTWVVAGHRFVAYTTDAGASFTAYSTTPDFLVFTDVDWVTADEYVASASDGRMYRATVAPTAWANWTQYVPGNLHYMTDIAVANASNAYITTRGGLVFHWNGTALSSVGNNDMRGHPLFGVATSTTNPTYVTAVGKDGRSWRSENSGSTWTAQDTATSATLYAAAMPSATHAWAAGSALTVSRSTTSGLGWSQRYAETTRPLNGIAAHPVDGRTAVAVGEAGSFRRTTTSGASWTAISSMGTRDLLDVEYASATTLWAVGKQGTIHRSVDGGATWSAPTSPISANLVAADAAESRFGWAVGDAGTIVRTTDGGATWTAQSSGAALDLTDVIAVDGQTAVAVGKFGTMRRTFDGGATWSAPATPPSGTLSLVGIAGLEGGTLVVADYFGNVRRSVDAGQTWATIPNSPGDISALESMDDGQSLAMTSWFDRYRTSSDRGSSWTSTSIGVGWGAIAVAPVDRHTSFVAFSSGRIVDIDESASLARQLQDYGGASTFGAAGSTSTFGVCVQAASGTLEASWIADPGGSCTAVDSDPWRAVPAAPAKVITAANGATGSVQLVWGARPRLDQPPGRYSAGVVFEAIAPAA